MLRYSGLTNFYSEYKSLTQKSMHQFLCCLIKGFGCELQRITTVIFIDHFCSETMVYMHRSRKLN